MLRSFKTCLLKIVKPCSNVLEVHPKLHKVSKRCQQTSVQRSLRIAYCVTAIAVGNPRPPPSANLNEAPSKSTHQKSIHRCGIQSSTDSPHGDEACSLHVTSVSASSSVPHARTTRLRRHQNSAATEMRGALRTGEEPRSGREAASIDSRKFPLFSRQNGVCAPTRSTSLDARYLK